MKKYTLLLTILILFSCIKDDDLPNQFTSVEGYVIDYYSQNPIPDLPLKIDNKISSCLTDCEYFVMDTIYTNKDGYYYYEFYNDSNRSYIIQVLRTENYVPSITFFINEGKRDTIKIPLKPFRTLNLNFYNKKKIFNGIRIFNYQSQTKFGCAPCEEFVCAPCEDTTFVNYKIIPEFDNWFIIEFLHYNKENNIDTTKDEQIHIFVENMDTTITYIY